MGSGILVLEEVLAEVGNVGLPILNFWSKLEDLFIVLATQRSVDLVYCDLEHLNLIDQVEHLIFFLWWL